MLTTQQEFQSELNRLADGVDDRDLEDGAGQVITELLRNVDDRIDLRGILMREHLSAAIYLLLSPSEGESRLDEGHLSHLVTALRLLWAGYYGEVVIEERHRWGSEGYRDKAIKRFRDRVFGHR